MIKYRIKINNEIVYRTDNMKEALNVITKMFNDGYEEISLHGGRLGKWWNN